MAELQSAAVGLALLGQLLAGCGAATEEVGIVSGGALEEVFSVVSEVQLQEETDDVIGGVGPFVELHDGRLLVSDPIQLRLRIYSSDGALLAGFGGYGGGPFEFRRIGGATQDGSGRLVIVDPALGRVTLLGDGLRPDTLLQLRPLPRGQVVPLADGLLFKTAPLSRSSAFTFYKSRGWEPVWSVPAPAPGSMLQYPYWGSVATTPLAASSREAFVAYSLRYPIYVFRAGGELTDSLAQAPPSFRYASVAKAGTFTGQGALERLERWLATFEIVADLAVVDDSILVVTHGTLRGTPGNRFSEVHDRVDVYHIPSRSKIAEDMKLPPGSRVLGGGSALYVLAAEPPDPWSIARYKLKDSALSVRR